jgi:glutathione S-transferase
MLLIGMFDSPFVRPVAVSLKLFGIPFEHGNWSVGKDFERIREFNPLVRVPTLVLDDGSVLIEGAAILDYLDEHVGEHRALLPRSGLDRRTALQIAAIATGAAERRVASRSTIASSGHPRSSTSPGSSAVGRRCMAGSRNSTASAASAAMASGW